MKKFLLGLIFLVASLSFAEGQQILYSNQTFTSVTTGAGINVLQSGISYYQLEWHVKGTVSACSVQLDSSLDGITWNSGDVIASAGCTANGSSSITAFTANYVRPHTITSFTGGGTLIVEVKGWSYNPMSGGGGPTSSVNLSQINGVTPDVSSGVKGSGTLRVVLATDQPQLTNKLLVTPDSVALPANQSVNISQWNGVTPIGGGVTGTIAVGGGTATASAVANNPVLIGGSNPSGNVAYIGGFFGNADGASGIGTALQSFGEQVFNGNTWDRHRSASAASLTQAVNAAAALMEFGTRVSVNSQPAVSNQATASVTAGGAGIRHIFDHVCFSGGATTAPAATQLAVNIRDGATGAGTVLNSFTVTVPAAVGYNVPAFCSPVGANIAGTANTAMTAEWSALLTNEFEQITLFYYNVQ